MYFMSLGKITPAWSMLWIFIEMSTSLAQIMDIYKNVHLPGTNYV